MGGWGGRAGGAGGWSSRPRRPVSTDLRSFVPATAELSVYALLFALILATLLAIGSTLRWPGAGLLRLSLIVGASVPAFLLAPPAILIFSPPPGSPPPPPPPPLPTPPTPP